THGSSRDAKDARYLTLIETVYVMQPRRRSQLLGATQYDLGSDVAVRQRRLQVLAASLRNRLGKIELGLWAQLAIAELVQAIVGRNPVDPGKRLAGVRRLLEVPVDSHEGLLGHVFGGCS